MPDGDCTGPRWKKGRRNAGFGRNRDGYNLTQPERGQGRGMGQNRGYGRGRGQGMMTRGTAQGRGRGRGRKGGRW